MNNCQVVSGKYTGKNGKCTDINKYGNVMFYPEDNSIYRVCLKAEQVRIK